MNITELARKLKVTPVELKEKLPELGFHVGRRAIQIPDEQVEKVIEKWNEMKKKEKKKERLESMVEEKEEEKKEEIKEVSLPPAIQVYRLAEKLNLPLNKVMSELIKNGIFTSLNEKIDYEIAAIIAENLGFKVRQQEKKEEIKVTIKEKIKKVIDQEKKEDLIKRPPVVVVCGHVDHGKTSLLDFIRQTKEVAKEKGGITQKIGAYQIEIPYDKEILRSAQNDFATKSRKITFIDTPGHEAFEAMRVRGGEAADLAILVIAADDKVQPQTIEAIKIITKENLPFVVAINKIDKPEADPEKIKKELSEINLVPEEWGGKTICVPVSAKTGQGIDELLETLLLLADLKGEALLANKKGKAVATVIESHLDPGAGPVAAVIVFNGSLKVGNSALIGHSYGKIRMMKNEKGETIKEAFLSQPVQISGLKKLPEVGEILEVIEDQKEFKKKIKELEILSVKERIKLEEKKISKKQEEKLKIILRADTLGSLEAVIRALNKIDEKEVKLEIVKKKVGRPTEKDVVLAHRINAQLINFNVDFSRNVEEMAKDLGVKFSSYDIIYHLIEKVGEEIKALKKPESVEEKIGKLKVLAIFGKNQKGEIVGGRVIEGKIISGLKAKIWREEKIIGEGLIKKLQINKEEVKEVGNGNECGVFFVGDENLKEGDILEFYKKTD